MSHLSYLVKMPEVPDRVLGQGQRCQRASVALRYLLKPPYPDFGAPNSKDSWNRILAILEIFQPVVSMNYASDRLDRKSRELVGRQGLYQDYVNGLTSGFDVDDSDIAAAAAKRVTTTRNDRVMANVLRDVGCNEHALYHYFQAWQTESRKRRRNPITSADLNLSEAMAVGDFAQMAEFSGNIWLGLASILVYRLNFLDNDGGEGDGNVNQAVASPASVPSYEEFWNWVDLTRCKREGESVSTKVPDHCGCGDAQCGQEIMALVAQNMSEDFNPTCRCSPLSSQAINTVVETVGKWLERQRVQADQVVAIPTANEMLRLMALRDLGRPESLEQSPMEVAAIGPGYVVLPPLLRIWEGQPEPRKELQRCSEDFSGTSEESKLRSLPPVLQMLTLKLAYLVLPQLAAVIAFHTPAWNKPRTAPDTVHSKLSSTDTTPCGSAVYDELTTTYKSHHAYDVLIRAVLWGERRKPHREMLSGHQEVHVPVWNVLHAAAASPNLKSNPKSSRKISVKKDAPVDDHCGEQFIAEVRNRLSAGDAQGLYSPLLFSVPTAIASLDPIFYLGDSHVLSLAWQILLLPGPPLLGESLEHSASAAHPRLVVPVVVTGLKAGHLHSGINFFTRSNWETCWQQVEATMSRATRGRNGTNQRTTILLSVGEIDCREGLGGEKLEGYSDKYSCSEHVEKTVDGFIDTLQAMIRSPMLECEGPKNGGSIRRIQQILVTPVPPHARQSKGRQVGRSTRRETTRIWNNTLKRKLSVPLVGHPGDRSHLNPAGGVFYLDYPRALQDMDEDEYVLRLPLRADSTHMNSAFAPFLIRAIEESKCQLDLL
jgi:hypothetical protein